MRTYSADYKINGVTTYETPEKVDRGFLTMPCIILLLCMLPDIPGLAITKIPIAILYSCLTLTAVLGALTGKIRVAGRGVFLAFLLITVLNFFNALVYGAPILRWMRIAFCSYVFASMFFFIVDKINTPYRRDQMWKLLVIFGSLASLLDFIAVTRYGLAGAFEDRAAGGQGFTIIAFMLILPVLGTVLAKKKWLLFFLIANMFLLFLSASRGAYLIMGAGILYTLFFIQKRFSYRLFFLLFVLMVGTVLINTPVYDRMADRFSSAAGGTDNSTMARVDEALSTVNIVRKNWATLIFGKGYGIPWKPIYTLSMGREPELPGGYMANAPHNDYAARLLYCGLVGLVVQLLLYIVIGFTCFAALRRSRGSDLDIYTKVRLHGALLVMMLMVMAGFAGGMFIFLKNNIMEAFIFGMAMADATEILSGKRAQLREKSINEHQGLQRQ
ncbi:MAG: O-antigen ligase family protein [Desulfobaccales bacterium]